jgi:hypothetical protein
MLNHTAYSVARFALFERTLLHQEHHADGKRATGQLRSRQGIAGKIKAGDDFAF